MNIVEEVKLDLSELKKCGVRVPAKAFKYVDANVAEIEGFRNDGMRISEIANLVIELV